MPLERLRSLDESLALYKRAMRLALRDEEQKLALSGLAHVRTAGSASFVKGFLDKDALKAEAELALETIKDADWTVTASHHGEHAQVVLDGELWPPWNTDTPQQAGQWIMVDMRKPVNVREIVLETPWLPGCAPERFKILLSSNRSDWREPSATRKGARGERHISFAPTPARFVAVVLTDDDHAVWIIQELRISHD